MSSDQEHPALPMLYGAPPHGLRRRGLTAEPRLGRDDLPIEFHRSPEDHELALELYPRSYGAESADRTPAVQRQPDKASDREPELRGTPLLLRALAGRLMRPKGD